MCCLKSVNVLLNTTVSYTLVWLCEVLPDTKNADTFHTPRLQIAVCGVADRVLQKKAKISQVFFSFYIFIKTDYFRFSFLAFKNVGHGM